MRIHLIIKILGILVMGYSLTMLPPVAIAFIYEDGGEAAFLIAFSVTLLSGILAWVPVRKHQQELRTRDGFLVVVLFWTVLSFFGALPFILADQPEMGITDAVFESVSGLTTTGATVLSHIDSLPKSILYYRQQLQWLGGMGIIVLAVAVLPMLGVGGMQLYRAETPGPMKDSKLTPRITETAKALWYIYLALTLMCAFSYWWAGMGLFDAVGHSFATVAIGGFSTHDASIGYFDSVKVEGVCIIFMLLSGVNFGLHFIAWKRKSIYAYLQDAEFRAYVSILLIIGLASVIGLCRLATYDSWVDALRYGVFETVSVATTTGFSTVGYAYWPPLIFGMLLIGSFIGGCAGSTGGGLKVIRIWLMFKQGSREIKRLVHPSAVMTIKVGNKPILDPVIEAVSGFVGAYISVFSLLMVAVLATGMDFLTAFSAVAASINNLGPGLGAVAANYSAIGETAKWILCFGMLLGRLEIFTLLVLFSSAFWKY